MTDFTLEPDELEPPRPARRRPVRLVSTGLHPLEAVPQTRGTARDPAYAPCAACGQPMLVGETRSGTRLALDVHVPTYCVLWGSGEALPVLEPSRGYPVHGCVGGVGEATPYRGKETQGDGRGRRDLSVDDATAEAPAGALLR